MKLLNLFKLVSLSASVLVVTTPAASLPENGTYYIWNSENKAVMDNKDGIIAFGNPIIGWNYQQPVRPQQQVIVKYTSDNTATLQILEIAQVAPQLGGYINIYDGYVVLGQEPQKWTIEPVSGQLGNYYIVQNQAAIRYSKQAATDGDEFQLTISNIAEANSGAYWQFNTPYDMDKVVSA
ncbi:uncharacterized protein FOMMEDRAFT_161703 [Fomitiporia mediterranea MF3/22]|uniref:uncharacterized protein n=1 Tax=Fomitiporia mediterranea (strain MF3/22) TaxID=694068 RepID=UPI0004409198|nr:uncharacterized protein FOMMEDRAFT_161703 [Fomitiporia mediterranea MF3/22]EJC98346.1 hypothetical protein FOMMEDRAFT_161703 [Fomitiporia mediterranea MF3/22]